MKTKYDYLDELRLKLGSDQLPEFFNELEDAQLKELDQYTHDVVENYLQGLDKMMNSMTQSMKYIPNVFLQMMAKKYVDPVFSARLTQKMKIKDVVALTKGMPVEYVGEVTAHQEDNALSAEIMAHMKTKDIEPITEYVCQNYPVKALDIAMHLPDKLLKLTQKYSREDAIPEQQWTDERKALWQRMQSL